MLLAHAGHRAAQLLYLAPVIAMIVAIVWARLRGVASSDEPASPDGDDGGHGWFSFYGPLLAARSCSSSTSRYSSERAVLFIRALSASEE